jgi:ferredoxin
MCQRYTKLPRACDLCIAGCPTCALEPREHTLFTSSACLKCGACLTICPTSALGATKQTIQELTRKLLDATLKTPDLVLTCQRTHYMAKAAAAQQVGENTVPPELASSLDADALDAAGHGDIAADTLNAAGHGDVATDALNAAEADGILYTVACLGMLPTAIWFALLNEIEITGLELLGVLLPPGQCANCPVNAKANVEQRIDAAIGLAELWAQSSVELYAAASELPSKRDVSLLGFLRAPDAPDRREALTGVFRGLKSAWDELGTRDTKALREVQIKRERKDAHKRTLLGESFKRRPAGSQTTSPRAIVVPSRYALLDAIGRNPSHAAQIILEVSETDTACCTLCGNCVDACPLHARSIVEVAGEGVGADVNTDVSGVASAGAGEGASEVASVSKVVCDPLYCVACKACLEACQQDAIYMQEISADMFLLDEKS